MALLGMVGVFTKIIFLLKIQQSFFITLHNINYHWDEVV